MQKSITELTTQQRQAVESTKHDVRIIAGAGSGKTRVVAKRVIYLIKSGQAEPQNIVAFTYTDKAAREMKSRIYEYAKQELGTTKGFGEMFVGTIHSFCIRILQDYSEEYSSHQLLDPIKLKLFVQRHSEQIGMKELGLDQLYDISPFIDSMGIISENPTTKKAKPYLLKVHEKYTSFLLDNKYFDFALALRKAYEQIKTNELNARGNQITVTIFNCRRIPRCQPYSRKHYK